MNLYRKLSGLRTSLARTKSKTSSQDFSAVIAAMEDEKVDRTEQSSGMEAEPELKTAAGVEDPSESGNDPAAATPVGTQVDADEDDEDAQLESGEDPKAATEESSIQNSRTVSETESPGDVGPESSEVSKEGFDISSAQDTSTNPEKESSEDSAVVESTPTASEFQEAAPKSLDEGLVDETHATESSIDTSSASEVDRGSAELAEDSSYVSIADALSPSDLKISQLNTPSDDGSHSKDETDVGGENDVSEVDIKTRELGNSVLEKAGVHSSDTLKEVDGAEHKNEESAEHRERVAHINHENHKNNQEHSNSKPGGGGLKFFMVLFSFSAIVGLVVTRK